VLAVKVHGTGVSQKNKESVNSMQNYDFDRIMQEEAKLAERMSNSKGSGGKDFKYKLLYPGKGTTSVKLLFNPKSNMYKREFYQHDFGKDEGKTTCVRTYGMTCEIDPVLRAIKNVTGQELSHYSRGRGVSFVQFIRADYDVNGGAIKSDIQPNEIILLMYPWTVFRDFGLIVNQAKTKENIAKLISSNEGYVIDITRTDDNKYSARVGAFDNVAKTIDLHDPDEPENPEKVELENKKFFKLIESLDPLSEQPALIPAEITDEIIAKEREKKSDLNKKFLNPSDPNVRVEDKEVTTLSTPPARTETEAPPKTNTVAPSSSGKPSCYGKFGSVSYEENCLRCREEALCEEETEGKH